MAAQVLRGNPGYFGRPTSIAAALRVALRAAAVAVVVSLGYGASPASADIPIQSSIETGGWGSCGLTSSGVGTCWGYTDQTGQPPSSWTLAAISIDPSNANSCALTVYGNVSCWKNVYSSGLQPPNGTSFRSVSAGSAFNCGITSDWDAICWGSNVYGGTSVPSSRKWLKVSAGASGQACGVTTANVGLCWGANASEYDSFLAGRRWTDLRAGVGFSCGVTTAGEGRCSGSVDFASLMPSGKTWAMVDPGHNGTFCGLTTDGEGYCAGGFQSGGGLGGGGLISGGGMGGGLISGGGGDSGPATYMAAVPGGYRWRTLSAGSSAACGITTTNEAKCWGSSISSAIPSGLQWGSPAAPVEAPAPVSSSISFDAPYTSGSGLLGQAAYTMIGFSLAASYGSITCKLDDGAWGDCPGFAGSGGRYSTTIPGRLALGSHTLSVQRADGDGIVLASGSTSWTLRAPDPQSNELSPTSHVIAPDTVGKGKTLRSSGWDLPALAPGSPGPQYRWQRCDASGDESSCVDILGEGGATGAWWGTRNSDIGKRLRVKVTFTNIANVLSSVYSSLSSVIGSINLAAPALNYGSGNSGPVVGTPMRSSFGTWAGYVAGVSTVVFQWQSCSSNTNPDSNCADIPGSTGQWYRPRSADSGRYLRVKATLTTRGQSNVAASAVSGAVTAPIMGRRRSETSARRSVGGRPASPGRSTR